MPLFDEQAFLKQTYTEAGSTKYAVVPEGSDWKGVSKKLGFKKINYRDKETGEAKVGNIMILTWEIEDPRLEPIVGRKTAQVRQEFWLELKPNNAIDFSPGKNRQLSLTREQFGQNVPGQVWGPEMLIGQAALLTVTHRAAEDGEVYASVKEVKKL